MNSYNLTAHCLLNYIVDSIFSKRILRVKMNYLKGIKRLPSLMLTAWMKWSHPFITDGLHQSTKLNQKLLTSSWDKWKMLFMLSMLLKDFQMLRLLELGMMVQIGWLKLFKTTRKCKMPLIKDLVQKIE